MVTHYWTRLTIKVNRCSLSYFRISYPFCVLIWEKCLELKLTISSGTWNHSNASKTLKVKIIQWHFKSNSMKGMQWKPGDAVQTYWMWKQRPQFAPCGEISSQVMRDSADTVDRLSDYSWPQSPLSGLHDSCLSWPLDATTCYDLGGHWMLLYLRCQ